MENIRVLKVNSVKCLSCNTVLVSKHRHDYVSCNCDNRTFVDGGNSYVRLGGMDLTLVEDLAEYEEITKDELEDRAKAWKDKADNEFQENLLKLVIEMEKNNV